MARPVTLKVAGAWTGEVTVNSLSSPTQELREAIARHLGTEASSLKVIVGGRTLQEEGKTLEQSGVCPTARILVLGGPRSGQRQLRRQEAAAEGRDARVAQLQRLRQAAEAIAKRKGEGDGNVVDFALENQDGLALRLDNQEDRKFLVMGMALHEKGRASLLQGNFKEAEEELLLAEEAWSACDPKLSEKIDNVALLLLDLVWCMFRMRDVARLASARERLADARRRLAAAHGPALERMRVLHGAFRPELAMYVRLEVLEGVVAYHAGERAGAVRHLTTARGLWQQLQVADDALAALLAMGCSSTEATRALRFHGGQLEPAAAFVLEQRAMAHERKRKRAQERAEHEEQRRLGTTVTGQLVNLMNLKHLEAMGPWTRDRAIDALKKTDNDVNLAMDRLLQDAAADQAQYAACHGKLDAAALASLLCASSSGAIQTPATCHVEGARSNHGVDSAKKGRSRNAEEEAQAEPSRDAEMENELASAAKADPLAAYDVDVTTEGEVIEKYLAYLQDSSAGPALVL